MQISTKKHIIFPLILLVGLFLIFDHYGLDLWCSDQFYFGQGKGWYYKHSWWAEQLIHRGGRYLIISIAVTCLLIIAESFSLGSQTRRYRRAALYLLLCIALGTGTVALGKETINRHCPWDYSRYGGNVQYTNLLTPPAIGSSQGHGFPAGHASGAFSLLGFYFIFYQRQNNIARIALVVSLTLGALFTFGQLVRGAHFVSHSIVSLGLCWFINLFLFCAVFKHDLYSLPKFTEKSYHESLPKN